MLGSLHFDLSGCIYYAGQWTAVSGSRLDTHLKLETRRIDKGEAAWATSIRILRGDAKSTSDLFALVYACVGGCRRRRVGGDLPVPTGSARRVALVGRNR